MLRISRRLIDVTGMRDIVQRRIPLLTLDSKKPGPTVWLAGCIHGDEPGGAVIIHEVFKAVRESGMAGGVIHALPLINVMGFENVSRFINSDREDLNRCFPGDPKGTMGQRFAHRLFELVAESEPDLVIDLHNDWIQSVPYVLIDSPNHFASHRLYERTVHAAAATGLVLVEDPDPTDEMLRSLTGACVAAGISAFTLEAGGACGIVEAAIDAGKAAVFGALADLGVTKANESQQTSVATRPCVLSYTSHPRSTSSGIVRYLVTPGDQIESSQKVAEVYSAFGSAEETLHASHAGYVLGVADHARAMPGSEIIAIAEFDRAVPKEPDVQQLGMQTKELK